MTRSPASASENRAHGAEKIGPRRYSDFFNRITQQADIFTRLLQVGFGPILLKKSKI